MAQVWLELVSGSCCFAQLFVDVVRLDNWPSLGRAGLPKLSISSSVFVFDAIFIAQHYWLYRHREAGEEERAKLLP